MVGSVECQESAIGAAIVDDKTLKLKAVIK